MNLKLIKGLSLQFVILNTYLRGTVGSSCEEFIVVGVAAVELCDFDSLSVFSFGFFGGRFFGGGAFDMQPWQYHFPRGTFNNGGMQQSW